MRVLVLYAHPVETSFDATVHATVLAALARAGHTVDDFDLYAEGFDPVLSREERLTYEQVPANRAEVEREVARLQAAEAVVFVFPTWSFGPPAILKGFFDRVLLPGVAFALEPDGLKPLLTQVRRVVGIVTYGQPWWKVKLGVGDLPRRQIMRVFKWSCGPRTRAAYCALYDMDRRTAADRARFLGRVERAMAALA